MSDMSGIAMNNLRRLDINLLLTLDVLLSEHNVTRAAQRLNLSQPSVSVHLAKLRDIFGDPLLLPGPRGMRPTARADELREPLREALEALGKGGGAGQCVRPGARRRTPGKSPRPITASRRWCCRRWADCAIRRRARGWR